jgi:alkylation response protein AidB-like acyl-CoA dehydrogenase
MSMAFVAPLRDIRFVLNELAGLDKVRQLPGGDDIAPEIVDAVLEENARLLQHAVAPLNHPADRQPATLAGGVVTTSPGFKAAFREFVTGGWQGLSHPTKFGGQGLPKLLATPCVENLNAASLSFGLCPLLTDGAIEVLLTAGTPAQRALYVPKLVDGTWTGTMNLTEPQAGSDLSQVRTRAVPQGDGTYRLFGQKIYITYGEHDLAENIVHMVLARLPDAPEGVKGISLFMVPKFLVNDDGSLGARNDVWCASLEHKLGIKASPTAVLLYGDNQGDVGAGAVGTLIGTEHRGLETMFIMMNAARFAVGVQGVAISERAMQQAVSYARDRVQSRAVEGSAGPVAIVQHPDVRRNLMTMRALTQASRAMAYVAAGAFDFAHRHPDAETRQKNQALYEYMVPIIKGFATEMAIEVTSTGVQVHGGMGFIEETGAAQHYRDARILAIYEGTTAIQANDLVGRKTVRDQGAVARGVIAAMRETHAALLSTPATAAAHADLADLSDIARFLATGIADLEACVDYVVRQAKAQPREVHAGSVPYLMLSGYVHGGWQMARAAVVCRDRMAAGDLEPFLTGKLATARFYCSNILPRASALRTAILEGSAGVLALDPDQF